MYKHLVYHAHSIREKKEEIQLCKMQQNKVERERGNGQHKNKKKTKRIIKARKKRFFEH